MEYRHKHHIVPKHAGGTDDPSNIVEVTPAEHAELHFARYLESGAWGDYCAAMGLSSQWSQETLDYEKQRYWLGKKRSEETKAKMRKPHGPKHTAESRAKISAARKGKKLSEEHKRKISEGGKRRYGRINNQN